MITELTPAQFKNTFGSKMLDVTESAEPVTDIWPYVEELTKADVVVHFVLNNRLIEYVYRNAENTYDHVLLPTAQAETFIAIVVDLNARKIMGHIVFDFGKEYA